MEEFAAMIRKEIEKTRANAVRCGWHPSSTAWHRAFGELSGMYKILQLVDPDANQVALDIPTRVNR